MLKAKRIAGWAVTVLFVALAAWWSCYYPYDAACLNRAIPSNAVFLSEHQALAGRWREALRNPLVANLAAVLTRETNVVEDILGDANLGRLIDRLTPRRTVAAYVPSLGGSPAWVFASWVGGYGQYLRAMLRLGLVKGFRRVSSDHVSGWVLDADDPGATLRFGLAAAEGVAVGCLARNPEQVLYLVRRLRSAAPVAPSLAVGAGRAAGGRRLGLDRAWVDGALAGPGGAAWPSVGLGLTTATATGLSGWAKWTPGVPEPGAGAERSGLLRGGAPEIARLDRILGPSPCVIALAPFAALRPWVAPLEASGPGAAVIEALSREQANGAVAFAAVLGGDYSGRLFTLKVPTVLAGMEVRDGCDAMAIVTNTFDRLNALGPWGLIPRRQEIGGLPVVILDSSRLGAYADLAAGERPALAVLDGWLLLCSSVTGLEQVLRGYGGATPGGEALAAWLSGLREREAAGYLWAALGASDQALRNAVAVGSLLLMVSGRPDRVDVREALDRVKAVSAAARAAGTASVWLSGLSPEAEMFFTVGDGRIAVPSVLPSRH